ncbi:MAG: hypothetical protein LAT64_14010 [Phycisphaerales bacterium]|nr:hypothetical protein [Planctomycetota bacterium]MCH8509865.1 hypothetical protein [Phycisphaerales bacterium]
MTIRLGDLLVQHRCLTTDQRDEILRVQRESGRPFGLLAEELFGVSPSDVEHAWAAQYAAIAPRFDPRLHAVEPEVLNIIERRQAWQFRLIPVRKEGDELVFVTSVEDLARALRFTGWRINGPCTFCICDRDTLMIGLSMHYPIDGMDHTFIDRVMDDLEAA